MTPRANIGVLPHSQPFRTPALSCSARLPSPCTAGEKTLSSRQNSSSMARIDSQNVKARTLTSCNHTSTTLAAPTQASTSTHSLSAPKSTSHQAVCNFSRIDNATLQLVLSNATVEGTKTAKVRVYATNYNVLRVMSGMGWPGILQLINPFPS